MIDETEIPLITATPSKGLQPATRLARVMTSLDGVRMRYQTWMPEAQRQLAGQGRLQVQIVGATLCCKVLGDVFLRSRVEFCFHSFWLTRRSMVMLVRGTAEPPDMEQPLPAGSHFHPVEWRKDAVESARAWVEQARRD